MIQAGAFAAQNQYSATQPPMMKPAVNHSNSFVKNIKANNNSKRKIEVYTDKQGNPISKEQKERSEELKKIYKGVTKDEKLQLNGMLDYGKNKKLDLHVNSDKIHFQNLIMVTKAFLDSIQVRNSLDTLKGQGYFEANANIKTNFKKLISNGSIIVKDGAITNKFSGLGFTKTNLNFLFDNNILYLREQHTEKEANMIANAIYKSGKQKVIFNSYSDGWDKLISNLKRI